MKNFDLYSICKDGIELHEKVLIDLVNKLVQIDKNNNIEEYKIILSNIEFNSKMQTSILKLLEDLPTTKNDNSTKLINKDAKNKYDVDNYRPTDLEDSIHWHEYMLENYKIKFSAEDSSSIRDEIARQTRKIKYMKQMFTNTVK